jgi:hypothetical protein
MVAEDQPILQHCGHPLTAGGAATRAHVAQQAEHFLGKEEVSGSNPDVGSTTVVAHAYETASKEPPPDPWTRTSSSRC